MSNGCLKKSALWLYHHSVTTDAVHDKTLENISQTCVKRKQLNLFKYIFYAWIGNTVVLDVNEANLSIVKSLSSHSQGSPRSQIIYTHFFKSPNNLISNTRFLVRRKSKAFDIDYWDMKCRIGADLIGERGMSTPSSKRCVHISGIDWCGGTAQLVSQHGG
jgi:hypothetical protein